MGWLLKGEPFEVQQIALDRAEGRKGYNWFLEQGLGKTPVCYADFLRIKATGLVTTLVVVCPNSLKGNWLEEAKKWETGLRVFIWEGKPHSATERYDVYVFNYECTLQSGGDYMENLLIARPCMMALDESQRIKNPSSKTTQRILGNYGKNAVIKRCLSGTPMTKTVLDLYPQLRFAGALNGSNPISFKNRFAETGGFKGRQITGIREDRIDQLKALIEESGFRATKEQYADLPPKLYKTINIGIPDALKAHYITMHDEFIVAVSQDEFVVAEMVASQYCKLQQISSGFILDGDTVHRLMPTRKLPKYEALRDTLDANGTQSKTLIFAHFRETCKELLHTLTEDLGHGAVSYILGGMKTPALDEQKERFNNDSAVTVMVLQIAAGREGHTLLGSDDCRCHTTVYYENNFNLGDRMQSEDRNHRYGQDNAVLYVDMPSSDIESIVIRAYQSKKELVQFVLDNKPRTM